MKLSANGHTQDQQHATRRPFPSSCGVSSPSCLPPLPFLMQTRPAKSSNRLRFIELEHHLKDANWSLFSLIFFSFLREQNRTRTQDLLFKSVMQINGVCTPRNCGRGSGERAGNGPRPTCKKHQKIGQLTSTQSLQAFPFFFCLFLCFLGSSAPSASEPEAASFAPCLSSLSTSCRTSCAKQGQTNRYAPCRKRIQEVGMAFQGLLVAVLRHIEPLDAFQRHQKTRPWCQVEEGVKSA